TFNNSFPFPSVSAQSSSAASADDVGRLHDNLFKGYRKNIRPVRNQFDAVNVNISFFIIMIHDLDLKNQVLTTNAWLRIAWHDEFLRWNTSDYNGLSEILVSRKEVWTPDLLVENTTKSIIQKSETEGIQNQDKTGTKANKQKPPPYEKKRTPDMGVRPGAQEE
ncbi:hypothetical protein FSP39_022728, partial [Pinctada imbricata]